MPRFELKRIALNISLCLSVTGGCLIAPAQFASAQTGGSGGALINERPTVVSKPVPLNWRSINWPSLNYSRTAIDGGAALYSIYGETGKKLGSTSSSKLEFIHSLAV